MTSRSAVAGSAQVELSGDSAQTVESAVGEDVEAVSQGLAGLTDVPVLLPKVSVPFEPAPMRVASVEVEDEEEQGCGRVVGQAQDPKPA